MTMPTRIHRTCYICHSQSEQTALLSTNTFGSPDLDMRPPEMMRSTMNFWLQECPVCGYVSDELYDVTTVDAWWLKQKEYMTCSGIPFRSELAKKFYRQYLINLADRNPEVAFRAIHRAAWACDDSNETELAVRCRLLAIISLEEYLAQKPGNEDMLLIKADLLRRAGMFQKLQAEYSNMHLSQDVMNQIIAFQLEMAKKMDTAPYTVAEAQSYFTSPEKDSASGKKGGYTIPLESEKTQELNLDERYFREELWKCHVCSAGNLMEHERCISCGAFRFGR